MSLPIQEVMTRQTHSIGHDLPVLKAKEMMHEYGIRHLPVREGGTLVGIISQSDIQLVESLGRHTDTTVEDVMMPDPYTAKGQEPLANVLRHMHDKKIGATIVVTDRGEIQGIFTVSDALRLLAERV